MFRITRKQINEFRMRIVIIRKTLFVQKFKYILKNKMLRTNLIVQKERMKRSGTLYPPKAVMINHVGKLRV